MFFTLKKIPELLLWQPCAMVCYIDQRYVNMSYQYNYWTDNILQPSAMFFSRKLSGTTKSMLRNIQYFWKFSQPPFWTLSWQHHRSNRKRYKFMKLLFSGQEEFMAEHISNKTNLPHFSRMGRFYQTAECIDLRFRNGVVCDDKTVKSHR